MSSEACSISLDSFEGPLDLLLYLIRRDELDIRELPVARVAEQYLEYLRRAEELDLEIAGEYLVMAATLTGLKSRALLPPRRTSAGEEAEDPAGELMRQLALYKAFREVASELRQSEDLWRDSFAPPGERARWTPAGEAVLPSGIGLLDLISALDNLTRRAGADEVQTYARPELPISACIDAILARLGTGATLSGLLGESRDRSTLVGYFIALLELVRQGTILFVQAVPFGEIRLAPAARTA